MYISKTDIEDRAILNGMDQYGHDPQEDNTHMFMTDAEDQLTEEHIWDAYQLHEETVVALSDQGILGASDLAWKLISGMGPDDECCHDDSEVAFYYREWEIKFYGFQWRFDHQIDNETFWDTDLLPGIAECDLIDNKPLNIINRYGREANLNDLQRAMLDITLLRFTRIIINKAKGQE